MPSKDPWVRLSDIETNAARILQYTEGMAFEEFKADLQVQDAVERCIARISEAAVKLGPFASEILADHDWSKIRSIGNVLRHAYDNVQTDIIWAICVDFIPALKRDISIVFEDSRNR